MFRASSPACPCDLVTLSKDSILRIEVTTGKRDGKGNIKYALHNTDNYDIIAVVLPDGIFYYPDDFLAPQS